MPKSGIIRIISILIIVGSGISLYLFLHPPPPAIDLRPHHALGNVLADEALKLAGSQGRILLFARNPRSFPSPATKAQLEGFYEQVAKTGGKIASTNLVSVDPLRTPVLPEGDVFERLMRSAPGDVLVSLIGPPVLKDDQIRRLGEKPVKVVAVCTGNATLRVDLPRLFSHHLLQVAIISRTDPLPRPTSQAPGRAWFDALYQILTPETAGDAPHP